MEAVGSRKKASEVAGKSVDMLISYAKGRIDAPFQVLTKLAEATGVSLDWLATGKGPMRLSKTDQAITSVVGPIEIDEELHGRVVDGIVKLYDAEKVRLQPIDLGRLSVRMYADILAAGPTSRDEQLVALRYALEQLRRQLRTPPTNDAEHKRLA